MFRNDLSKWVELFSDLFISSKEASLNALDLILEHESNSNFIKYIFTYLLVSRSNYFFSLYFYDIFSLNLQYLMFARHVVQYLKIV